MNDAQIRFSTDASQDETAEWAQTRAYSNMDWESHRARIYELYIEKDQRLNKVIAIMDEKYGFKATSRMYKSRFDDWGYTKNVKQKHWQAAALLWDEREKAGKDTIAFIIHEKRKTLRELKRYIKSRGLTEKEFVANARAAGASISTSAIRCVTPDPIQREISSGDSAVRPSTSSSYSFVGPKPEPTPKTRSSRSSGTSRPRASPKSQELPAAAETRPQWAMELPDLIQDTSSTDNTDFSSGSVYSTQSVGCDHLQQDLGFMLVQTYAPEALTAYPKVVDVGSWALISPPDPVAEEKTCFKCKQPSRSHSPVPVDWLWNPSSELPQKLAYQTLDPSADPHPDNDDASQFSACCYAACMFGGQEKFELLAKALHNADHIFEKMLRANNSMTLLSVLMTLTILHAHDRGSMAASIIRSTYQVAARMLGEGNPISLTLAWLTAAAGSKLPQCHIKTATLKAVNTYHEKHFGAFHQHCIVSRYCLAFNLILDKDFVEAETQFSLLSTICEQKLGPRHLQTVSALNGLGRAQQRQGHYAEAIATLQRSLDSHPLGPNHPYRLESMRRLSIIYKKPEVGRKDLAEDILWTVLRGRIKTLGKTHTETENARRQLQRLLEDMGKWDQDGKMAERVQMLFDNERATGASDFENF